jgi:phosphatidylglycerophosphate synthase
MYNLPGTKIPVELETPYDNLMYFIGSKYLDLFKFFGATPNILTIVGGLVMLLYIFAFMKRKYGLAALAVAVSFWFDCFDGQFARYHNMTSKRGAQLDQVVDRLRDIIILVSIVLSQISLRYKVVCFVVFAILMTTAFYNTSCQQQYFSSKSTSKDTSHMGSIFTMTCHNNPSQQLQYTRYFGTGTRYVFIMCFLLYIN